MKHVIICLLSGIAVLTISTMSFAQDAEIYAVATAEPATVVAEPVESKPPPPPKNNADNLIVPGAILTLVGGVFTLIGGIVLGTGLNKNGDNCSDDECDGHAYTSDISMGIPLGGTFLCIGGSALITGVVLLSVGAAKRKKMEREKLAFDIQTKRGKLTLEPTFAAGENGGMFGLSGRF